MVRFRPLHRYPEDAMSTSAQILANRQNSLLSTGPTSVAGKAASSRSALTHGLSAADPVLPFEDREAFTALRDAYHADFTPQNAHQEFLVHEMASARWKIERANRIENAILCSFIESNDADESPELKIAHAMMNKDGHALTRLERHRAALERTYHRCARELRAAKKSQNEATSQQLAQNKFDTLVKNYISAPVPDIAPPPAPEPPPSKPVLLAKVQNEAKPAAAPVKPGPRCVPTPSKNGAATASTR